MTELQTRVAELMRHGWLFGSAVLTAKVEFGFIDLTERQPNWLESWRVVRHTTRNAA